MWNAIFGTGANYIAQGSITNGMIGNPQNAYGMSQAQQSAMQQQYNHALTPKWMINGQAMTFETFVNTIFPEDCPEKTFFLLKFSKDENVKSN